MRDIRINGYKRIGKRTAKKLYEMGKPVLFCPVNLRPGGMWGIGCTVIKKEGRTFEQDVTEFEFYNCNNNEAGYYTAFYIKE